MQQVTLKEAENRLEALIEAAAKGEEILITRNDGLSFRLVAVSSEEQKPKFGSARDLVKISPDFDEPLADFESYAP